MSWEVLHKPIYRTKIEKKEVQYSKYDLGVLTQYDIQQYRIRYILAKLTQSLDEKAWGSSPALISLDAYLHKGVDIEHILPQNPSAMLKSSFDLPDQYQVISVGSVI